MTRSDFAISCVLAVGALLVSTSAVAQQITNLDTGTGYTDLAAAVAAATSGDTLEVTGTLTGSTLVDRDLTIVAAQGGGTLQSTGDFVIDLIRNVSLTVDGLDLIGLEETHAIVGLDGGNAVAVSNATIRGRVDVAAAKVGGAIYLDQPAQLTLANVVFEGTEGQPEATLGGAIWVYSTIPVPVTLTDVTFEHIAATGSGGAIWASGVSLSCTGCAFDHTKGAFGGAIYSDGPSLSVERSSFCGSDGTLGGAIFSSADTEIYASVFQENTSFSFGGALYANGGRWTVVNNHFVGNGGNSAFYAANLPSSMRVANNLFLGNTTLALDLDDNAGPDETYNWFHDNADDATRPLDDTNVTDGGDPGLVSWTFDDDCTNDELWHTATSPLVDAGDPRLEDPDGSRSDIGAYGGPWADPSFHPIAEGEPPTPTAACEGDPIPGDVSAKIALDFEEADADHSKVKVKNLIPPPGFTTDGVAVRVDLGGSIVEGTLDDDGKFKSADRLDKIKLKQKQDGTYKLSVKRKQRDLAPDYADEGLLDEENPSPGKPVVVGLCVSIDDVEWSNPLALTYKSQAGERGTAK